MIVKTIFPWSDRLPKTAPDTNTLTIYSERVEKGVIAWVHICNIVDETTTNKLLEIGTEKLGEHTPIVKQVAGASNYCLAPNTKNILLEEGERLYGKVYSPTAGDKCYLTYNGEICMSE